MSLMKVRTHRAHKWSLILFGLDFANGAFFKRLVSEGCDAVCQFWPAYLVSGDCHGVYASEAYGHVHPDFGYSSPTQILHHKLELSSLKASFNSHPQPVKLHQPRIAPNFETLRQPQIYQRILHIRRIRNDGFSLQLFNRSENVS